jgi:hypothetical protein
MYTDNDCQRTNFDLKALLRVIWNTKQLTIAKLRDMKLVFVAQFSLNFSLIQPKTYLVYFTVHSTSLVLFTQFSVVAKISLGGICHNEKRITKRNLKLTWF